LQGWFSQNFGRMFAKVCSFISRSVWLALILMFAPAAAWADSPSDSEIRALLRDYIERDHWGVGIVVGIVDEHGSRIISYGRLDNGSSWQVDEMKLDDPVEKFLPEKVKIPSKGGRKN
jgi:serine-type D-Ala-D-Ala carboxypeptidase/endopeptidase